MKLTVKPSAISGNIAVPGSKSHTIRAIAAALAAKGRCVLHSPLVSDDTMSTLNAACMLGAKAEICGREWIIEGCGGHFTDPGKVLNLGNSGTGLRMLCAMAANAGFPVTFDGDSSLRTRLMEGELKALQALGAEVSSTGGKCPLTVKGPLKGGPAKVDGTTSQYLTALLFASVLAPEDTVLNLDFLNEKPYVNITLNWLDRLGIRYECTPDLLHCKVFGGQHFPAFDAVIPADFSTAAFPLAAAALTGRGVGIRNLDFNDAQGDKAVFGYFRQMGAVYSEHDNILEVLPASDRLAGCDFDLNSTPDALPVMAAAGVLANGITRLLNVPQARVKETDRIECMARELSKMGAVIEELPDGMVIHGGTLHGAELDGCGDHRIVMALAVAALGADSPSVIHGAEAAAVTYPDFVEDFRSIGADFTVVD